MVTAGACGIIAAPTQPVPPAGAGVRDQGRDPNRCVKPLHARVCTGSKWAANPETVSGYRRCLFLSLIWIKKKVGEGFPLHEFGPQHPVSLPSLARVVPEHRQGVAPKQKADKGSVQADGTLQLGIAGFRPGCVKPSSRPQTLFPRAPQSSPVTPEQTEDIYSGYCRRKIQRKPTCCYQWVWGEGKGRRDRKLGPL